MERELYDIVAGLQDKHWWFIARKNYLDSILSNYLRLSPKRILDVGCGCGSMFDFLGNYQAKIIGLDDSEYALNLCKARTRHNLVRADVQKLPFRDGSFDFVTCFEILYHERITDDTSVLRELYRVCKIGGSILVIDSAFKFLKSAHDRAAHGTRRYSLKELRGKIEACGFNVRKATYLYMCLFPPVLITRIFKNTFCRNIKSASELRKTSKVVNNLIIYMLSLEALLLKGINLPFGISALCLADKVE